MKAFKECVAFLFQSFFLKWHVCWRADKKVALILQTLGHGALRLFFEDENLLIFDVLSSFHFKIYRLKNDRIQSNLVPLPCNFDNQYCHNTCNLSPVYCSSVGMYLLFSTCLNKANFLVKWPKALGMRGKK